MRYRYALAMVHHVPWFTNASRGAVRSVTGWHVRVLATWLAPVHAVRWYFVSSALWMRGIHWVTFVFGHALVGLGISD